MKKKNPRGRKSKIRKPRNTPFNEVIGAIGKSRYNTKKKLRAKKKSG